MANNANKNYASITAAEAARFDFSQVMEGSADVARWAGDNSECIVHWVGKTPRAITALRKPVKTHAVEKADVKSAKSKYITEGTNTAPFLRS